LRRRLLDLFRCRGYQLVVPPLVEYLDSLLTGTGRDLDLRTFKLMDQVSGRQLGLRADITPQTARIDAHILNRKGIVRLCYAGSVLHTRPAHPLASRQPMQVGAELYGFAGLAADAEVQRVAVDVLRAVDLSDATMDLGHTDIVRALIEQDPRAAALSDDLLTALGNKDAAALQELGRAIAPAAAQALQALIALNGPCDEVLARAAGALPDLPRIRSALQDLAFLAGRLQRIGVLVTLDLADLHGYRYYTGANFAAYRHGTNDALLRGGRYDHIGRAFGRARPAVGFSLDLRQLAGCLQLPPARAIRAPADDPADAGLADLVAGLRKQGEIVVAKLADDEVVDGLEFDREIRKIDECWTVVAVVATPGPAR
jgi:ATP phosphoribosyltransferase regulatory subunit